MNTTTDKLARRVRATLRALDEMGFDEDEPINGGDCVEVVAELLPPLRKALADYDAECSAARGTGA